MRKRSGGIKDNFAAAVVRIMAALAGANIRGPVPRRLTDRSKYVPGAGGARERARRIRQMERWWTKEPGCKLGPSNRGVRVR